MADRTWDSKFKLLKEYIEETKEFPTQFTKYKGVNLGYWVHLQRTIYNCGEITADGSYKYGLNVLTKKEKDLLESINFPWRSNTYEEKWFKKFSKLKELVLNNEEIKDKEIKEWISNQRATYINGKKNEEDGTLNYNGRLLYDYQIDLLNSIGFVWDIFLKNWENSYNVLKEFLNVYERFPKQTEKYQGVAIGTWCNTQRMIYINGTEMIDGSVYYQKLGKLTKEQIKKLEDINFNFVVNEKKFCQNEIDSYDKSRAIQRYFLIRYKKIIEDAKEILEVKEKIETDMKLQLGTKVR